MNLFFSALIVIFLGFITFSSQAALQIDINDGNVDPIAIALPYGKQADSKARTLHHDIIDVTTADLKSSGLFLPLDRELYIQDIPNSDTIPDFSSWHAIDAAVLLASHTRLGEQSNFDVQFRLWDNFSQKQLLARSYSTHPENYRRIGHMLADDIYHSLTGENGYFDSRIVYIAETGSALKRKKRLAIMDQDGSNHRYLTDGNHLVLTPRFSPVLQKVIYLSYKQKRPQLYLLDVNNGERQRLGDFSGMSFAPRFSPDHNQVVMSISRNGNSDIFTMNLENKRQVQLTNHPAIDTSPSFSPDGKKIVFNSDRGGTQQLYVMNKSGGHVKRISFGQGRYGTPVWSPRGDWIAFTKMHQGQFYIGVMRPDGRGERLLTQSFLDEGPSWSPNGRVLVFARQHKMADGLESVWRLYKVDLTGDHERVVETPDGASDPAWSPLLPR